MIAGDFNLASSPVPFLYSISDENKNTYKRNVKGKLRESITDWILCNKNLECELNYDYHENISYHYMIKCKLKVPNN